MRKEEFKQEAAKLGLELSAHQLEQFARYAHLLQEWNKVMNLSGFDAEEAIYTKHFYDSLLSIKSVNYGGTLADIGSGAGFPGLVLKIAYPSLKVDLIEAHTKRCLFLKEVIKDLALEGINVYPFRSEDLSKEKRESYDLVTARAVAKLNILTELCAPFVKVNGYFIALKGANGEKEIIESANAVKKLGLVLEKVSHTEDPDLGQRVIVLYRKEKVTPGKYPRNYGEIKKKPL